jgi:hypothetical protein
VGIPKCENQAIHTTHSAQLTKPHDATFPLNKNKHTITVTTQHVMLSHRFNITLLRFHHTVIKNVVQT